MADKHTAADDAEVMRIWRDCGLPEYFLGNGGSNHKLVAFAKACAALTPVHTVGGGDAQEVLERYRYAIDWIASDSWDFCSDCRERLEWARHTDPQPRLTGDEMAAIAKKYFQRPPTLGGGDDSAAT